MVKAGLAAILGAALVMALAWSGVPLALGAHPFWAVKVGYFGVGAGLLAVALLAAIGLRARMLGVMGLLSMIVAGAIASEGKARFAASYGDDLVAGRMWFFGWIAICAALFVVAFALFRAVLVARR